MTSLGFADLIAELYELRQWSGVTRVSVTIELPARRQVTIIVDRRGTRVIDRTGAMLNVATGEPAA